MSELLKEMLSDKIEVQDEFLTHFKMLLKTINRIYIKIRLYT